MDQLWIDFTILLFIALFVGIGIGMLAARIGQRRVIDEAKKDGEKVAERRFREEKEGLAEELHTHLFGMRESIVDAITAYESALKTVETKLPVPARLKPIELPASAQMQLDFEETRGKDLGSEEPPSWSGNVAGWESAEIDEKPARGAEAIEPSQNELVDERNEDANLISNTDEEPYRNGAAEKPERGPTIQ